MNEFFQKKKAENTVETRMRHTLTLQILNTQIEDSGE